MQMTGPAAGAGDLPDPIDRALAARALAWLAQREYSRHELHAKLMRHLRQPAGSGSSSASRPSEPVPVEPAGMPSAAARRESGAPRSIAQRVDGVLDWLERHQHLSQRRFVESRLHARSERYGNLRIRQEMALHGVSLPAELDAALRASELERARAVWQRKFGSRAASDANGAKQARFLAGRGFSGDVIRRVLRDLELDSDSTPATNDPSADAEVRPPANVDAWRTDTDTTTSPPLRLIAGSRKTPAAD